MGARKGANSTWTKDMLERLYFLTGAKVSATQIAVALSKEFNVSLSRNSVLGRLHRDRIAGEPVPVGLPPGGFSKSAPVPPIVAVKQRAEVNWRKDDVKWLTVIAWRKQGVSLGALSRTFKMPEKEITDRLRAVVADDIKYGDGTLEDWAWLTE